MNDGDWICSDPNCGNINFSRRKSCYRCNKDRSNGGQTFKKKLGTEIGKSAAEKSRGLFNPDDWQCNKCANVNWARRTTCNVCNAPKFGEVEARTGYGGGYNERGVVEYRKRDSSSDDEFDEFGRRKRKRKLNASETVGSHQVITDGPVMKKCPPTIQMKKPIAPKSCISKSLKNKNRNDVINSVLSDGSVNGGREDCNTTEKKVNNSKYYHNRSYTTLLPKCNEIQRPHYSSISDKDQSGSSSHESNYIKSNPVMENRVSSTNNDIVYKFTGASPTDVFEVKYTIEERVRTAAFAIVYNNCKISASRFESMYDKPAPDFQTIYAWRQRLLSTGCLVDTHTDKVVENTSQFIEKQKNIDTSKKICAKLPNPDEIIINLDSDDENLLDTQTSNNDLPFLERSVSVETLVIDKADNEQKNSVNSLILPNERVQSQASSTPNRTRSSSRESSVSKSSYSDDECLESNKSNVRHTPTRRVKPSADDSESDSLSYNSEEVDFRSRIFGENKSIKRRPRKIVQNKLTSKNCNTEQTFKGYTTQKATDQSPLRTGNIYMPHLTNMNAKHQENTSETDGLSTEYVPMMTAASAKKHYQDFKNNVKKKGYWAKGNGGSYSRNILSKPQQENIVISTPTTNYLSTQFYAGHSKNNNQSFDVPSITLNEVKYNAGVGKPINNDENKRGPFQPQCDIKLNLPPPLNKSSPYQQPIKTINNQEYAKDEFDSALDDNNFIIFGESPDSAPIKDSNPQNDSLVFDIVQSSTVNKTKNIMDIFNTDTKEGSPEESNTLDKYDNIIKNYESNWNDEDDALYGNTNEELSTKDKSDHTSNLNSNSCDSPTSNMLYEPSENKIDIEKKHNEMLLLLNDLQGNDSSSSSHQNDRKININMGAPNQETALPTFTNLDIPLPLSTGTLLTTSPNEQPCNSASPQKPACTISPAKKIHVLESITIKPMTSNLMSITTNNSKMKDMSKEKETQKVNLSEPEINENSNLSINPNLDLSNILSNINTNTLLMALQNLQKLSQPTNDSKNTMINESKTTEQVNKDNNEEQNDIETVNLTSDDWELESVQHESIERELQRLDGNTGDAEFLSDIFDPGPTSLNINTSANNLDDNTKSQGPHLNENAPVIGNFKSFALPKPLILNRLKLTVKQPEKNMREGKKSKRKKASTSASKDGEGDNQEEEEEESGDEADLSKYDLWGSDDEKANSKNENVNDKDNTENTKNLERGRESPEVDDRKSPREKKRKKSKSRSRSRSSSSSSSTSSTSSSSSSHTSNEDTPKNKFNDFNLNSERESVGGSPRGRNSASTSPRARKSRTRSSSQPSRRRSRDSRSGGESRRARDKDWSRDHERRDRSRSARDKTRRYSREGSGNQYAPRGKHR